MPAKSSRASRARPAPPQPQSAADLVYSYLALIGEDAPEKIAGLAAAIAQSPGDEAVALVGQAIAIREEAERQVAQRRVEILEGAGYDQLRELLRYLRQSSSPLCNQHAPKISEYITE